MAAPSEALHYRSATQLRSLLAAGQVSPAELREVFVRRIAVLDGTLHAFLDVDADAGRASAGVAAAAGLLQGLPYALKDNIDVTGWATTCHSRSRRGRMPVRSSEVAVRLAEAGGVLLGKNSMHELATGLPDLEGGWPAARNPWDTGRHPGGSSSGSAVAVAAGMAAFALGTDTGGSVRHPASACGVFGFKPAARSISLQGVVPLAPSFDHVGVLARGARDIPLVMAAVAHEPALRRAYASLAREAAAPWPARATVGVIDAFSTDLDADPALAHDFDEAVAALRREGCRIKRLQVPSLARYARAVEVLVAAEAWAAHGAAMSAAPALFGESARARVLAGEHLDPAVLEAARLDRAALSAELEQALREVDVAVSMSNLVFPCRIDDARALAQTYGRHARGPFNLSGHAAAVVPRGVSAQGLPLSLHLAVAEGREVQLAGWLAALETRGVCGFVPPAL